MKSPEECALERVKWLLAHGATVAAELATRGGENDLWGGTSLHTAAEQGSLSVLDALLSADGALALESFDDISQTPLACAAQAGQLEAARRLLAAGADPNANEEAKAGVTPLYRAVEGRHEELVILLLEHGADPEIRGWMNLNALDETEDWAESRKPELRRIHALLRDPRRRRVRAR